MSSPTRYTIASGPRSTELERHFFGPMKHGDRRSGITFAVNKQELADGSIMQLRVSVCITSLRRNNDSGFEWEFEGIEGFGQKVQGRYNTIKRTGWFTYLPFEAIDPHPVCDECFDAPMVHIGDRSYACGRCGKTCNDSTLGTAKNAALPPDERTPKRPEDMTPMCLRCGVYTIRAGSMYACPSCGDIYKS